MVKQSGLGKGIGALLQVASQSDSNYFLCAIEEIKPNPAQPRKIFSVEKLEELAVSIRENGIIQPLIVCRKSDYYELIAGERRWRAAQKAGLYEVPVVIQDVSEDIAFEMALIENIQREDLNVIEEAEAYKSLIDRSGLSQEELAKRVGKNRSTVANALRLLKLPVEIQDDIVSERLTMGHARALLSLDKSENIKSVRNEIIKKDLTVRGTEAFVRRMKTSKPVKKVKKNSIELNDLVERLKKYFKAKVLISSSSRGGKIEISYGSKEELERIIDLLRLK
ncbi:MAG: ParB/RepB/Spo0J family partition protein [Desulfuromonadales bacterium]|nr:ParB/RepB/Spo0J family partition protein [Desulfuromonadales bacterium]